MTPEYCIENFELLDDNVCSFLQKELPSISSMYTFILIIVVILQSVGEARFAYYLYRSNKIKSEIFLEIENENKKER